MVNENRVILMTKLASYEAREGKKYLAVGRYFRSDYISLQLLKSFISGTLAFCIMAGMAVLYDLEGFMKNFYQTADLIELVKDIGIIYLIMIGMYMLIVYVVAAYHYNRSRQSLKTYYGNLKKLSKYYDQKGNINV